VTASAAVSVPRARICSPEVSTPAATVTTGASPPRLPPPGGPPLAAAADSPDPGEPPDSVSRWL
jgi:hypothetical protein